jgi:Phosphohistidine phosphatase SixA
MRHAKSSHEDEELADHERPLEQRGRIDTPMMGKLLALRGLVPEAIISSTAVRARETAKLLIGACGFKGELELKSELYLATPKTYVQVLKAVQVDRSRIMMVGHCPGLEELLAVLTDKSRHLPTGAIAQIALKINAWKDVKLDNCGELLNLWLPRELS